MRDPRRLIASPGAARRLRHARRFVAEHRDAHGLLIVGATREAADELARDAAAEAGVVFGLHRFSPFQLAVRLAFDALSLSGTVPATSLAMEAIAARVAFDASEEGRLGYLAPIADAPGFPRALLATVGELRSAGVDAARLTGAGRSGDDMAVLSTLFDEALRTAGLADRVVVYRAASQRLARDEPVFCDGWPLVLVDVPVVRPAERDFIAALIGRCGPTLATCPSADRRTLAALAALEPTADEPHEGSALGRVQSRLFARDEDDAGPTAGAPGERPGPPTTAATAGANGSAGPSPTTRA